MGYQGRERDKREIQSRKNNLKRGREKNWRVSKRSRKRNCVGGIRGPGASESKYCIYIHTLGIAGHSCLVEGTNVRDGVKIYRKKERPRR